jgi:long-chain acyl-CoA synthetase
MFGLMVGLLVPVACGVRAVFPSALLPNRIIDALRDNSVTHALAVPALLECLYREGLRQLAGAGVIEAQRQRQSPAETAVRVAERLSEDDLDRIRVATRSSIGPAFHTVVVGGAAVDPAIVGILTVLGIRVEVGYGLTEASPVVCLGSAGKSPPGSVGEPLPGVDVRVDSNGEILVRGGNVMRGYFGDPEATEAAIRDGWLHTGDQGRMDESGHLFITGRLKEAMVTSAGETIYPEEIEPLYQDPLFGELCVTAIPGAHGNDVPTLFVLPANADVPEAELRRVFSDLRAGASPRLRIERMVLLEHPLPRTATGKVRRRVLANDFVKREAIT